VAWLDLEVEREGLGGGEEEVGGGAANEVKEWLIAVQTQSGGDSGVVLDVE
jgi:hypothetical protein